MSKKNKQVLLLVLLVFSLAIFFCFQYQSSLWRFFVKDGQLMKIVLKDTYFSPTKKELLVEVVINESSLQKGLSDRSQLQNAGGQVIDGMLFIFPEPRIRQFWMKDMQFDIDICWFNGQSLINCTRRALKPEDDAEDSQLEIYQSPRPADMVLETMPDFLADEYLESQIYLKLF